MHTQADHNGSGKHVMANPLFATKDGFIVANNGGRLSGGFSPVMSAAEVEKPTTVSTNNCHGGNCAAHCGVKLE